MSNNRRQYPQSTAAFIADRLRTPIPIHFGGDGTGGGFIGGGAGGNLNFDLSDTGVIAGTYGDATNVGQFTVDSKGRITFAQNMPITGGGGGSLIPLVDGAEPPALISDGAGQLILVDYEA